MFGTRHLCTPSTRICLLRTLLGGLFLAFATPLAGCKSQSGPAAAEVQAATPKSDGTSAGVDKPAQPSELDLYDLERPDRVIELPRILAEVSGVTDVSGTTLGCVQDEKGTIFLFDLESATITGSIRFGEPGDYEGLSYVNGVFYVLRSDGMLFKVAGTAEAPDVRSFALQAKTKNHEGLGYDPLDKRLLIASKSPPGKGKQNKERRIVYGFDPATDTYLPEPILDIEVDAIREFALAQNVALPMKAKKKGKPKESLRFLPASIAVHPVTQHIYMLSAIDKTLAVLDRQGVPIAFAVMDESLFPQPEGITFLKDGTMLVTNEGRNVPPTLLVLHQK